MSLASCSVPDRRIPEDSDLDCRRHALSIDAFLAFGGFKLHGAQPVAVS